MNRRKAIWNSAPALIVLMCYGCLSGCVTYKPVSTEGDTPESADLSELVAPGHKVRVVLRDGTSVKLQVVSIDNTRIVGKDTSINVSDIATIERRRVNVLGTSLIVVGVIALIGYELADGFEDGFRDVFRGN